ncbi:UNVERIFIED_CONTAM: hypothetical protein NCL1_60318 [Trichonephila clavipes]
MYCPSAIADSNFCSRDNSFSLLTLVASSSKTVPNSSESRVSKNCGHRYCNLRVAMVAEWSRYRIMPGLVTSSSKVPLKTRRVGQRCTLKLSRDETSSRWYGVVVRREGRSASSGVIHFT